MKRFALLVAAMAVFTTSQAMAIGELKKEWMLKFAPKAEKPDFYKASNSCNTCHVKGVKDKKTPESRNEYGKAMSAFLKSKNTTIDALKDEYKKGDKEKAVAKMLAMFEAVNKEKSKDGKTFGEKIEAGELPATDAGL